MSPRGERAARRITLACVCATSSVSLTREKKKEKNIRKGTLSRLIGHGFGPLHSLIGLDGASDIVSTPRLLSAYR